MRILKLHLKKRSYNIIVGRGILTSLGKEISKLKLGNYAYIITNAKVRRILGARLSKALLKEGYALRFKVIPDTEKSKSMVMSSRIIEDIVTRGKGKRIFILALGGGVVGDLSGFVASIYKRGIPYVQVPTTLLAQVDSSIGGKTAVDLSQGKNLIGAFYQPRLVFSDVKILSTLDRRQVQAGLAEVIKYGLIKDRELFLYLERRSRDILNLDLSALEYIVRRCSYIKARIVERDEKELKGIRTVLNFGHTIGHAIEASSSYKGYNHGEAVALGMAVACRISERLNLLSSRTSRRIEEMIKKYGLPTVIKGISLGKIISSHHRDKKFIGQKNRFILITDIGRTKIVENIPLSIIKGSIRERLG